MCGRFTITVPAAEIAELMGLPELPQFAPRYNIKPSQPILVVRANGGGRVAETPVWGFAPGWWTRPPVINAKVESIKEGSGLWRNAAKKGTLRTFFARRLLIGGWTCPAGGPGSLRSPTD
jgi:putative SOS response-associated peptidase YedK